MDLDPELDRLYDLPRDAFVSERDALARRLREAGEREHAARVAALRKPTVAAWAVNRLARERAEDVEGLLAAVDRLQAAQEEAIRGDPARFREAVEAHRLVLERLLEAADGVLAEAGSQSAATQERVRETLHAASVDEQARETLRAGRLERERQPGGLDALGLAGAVPAAKGKAARSTRRGRSGR